MKYRVRIKHPVMGVPITFLDKFNPKEFNIIGHAHDVHGNGGEGVNHGQFEYKGHGYYQRILVNKRKEIKK